jgi:hypothetical protein
MIWSRFIPLIDRMCCHAPKEGLTNKSEWLLFNEHQIDLEREILVAWTTRQLECPKEKLISDNRLNQDSIWERLGIVISGIASFTYVNFVLPCYISIRNEILSAVSRGFENVWFW